MTISYLKGEIMKTKEKKWRHSKLEELDASRKYVKGMTDLLGLVIGVIYILFSIVAKLAILALLTVVPLVYLVDEGIVSNKTVDIAVSAVVLYELIKLSITLMINGAGKKKERRSGYQPSRNKHQQGANDEKN